MALSKGKLGISYHLPYIIIYIYIFNYNIIIRWNWGFPLNYRRNTHEEIAIDPKTAAKRRRNSAEIIHWPFFGRRKRWFLAVAVAWTFEQRLGNLHSRDPNHLNQDLFLERMVALFQVHSFCVTSNQVPILAFFRTPSSTFFPGFYPLSPEDLSDFHRFPPATARTQTNSETSRITQLFIRLMLFLAIQHQ